MNSPGQQEHHECQREGNQRDAHGIPRLDVDDERPDESQLHRDEDEQCGNAGQAVVAAFANHGRAPPD
jgi:hypothetical protein